MAKKFTPNNLKLETNSKFADEDKYTAFMNTSGGTVKVMFFGPNKSEDYWHFRVQVHDDQWIEAFPKFSQIGIGFAKEDDENTNLPSRCTAAQIFEHIKHNKRYASIPDEVCLKAINMLKRAAKDYKAYERMLQAQEAYRHEPLIVNADQTDYLTTKEFKEKAVIKRGAKCTFVQRFTGKEYQKTAFNIYFGELTEGCYKYKVELYAIQEKEAIQRAISIIEHLAYTGEKELKIRNDFTGKMGSFIVDSKVCDRFIGL